MPFNRATRGWVYKSAKNEGGIIGFGSTNDLSVPGSIIFVNHPYPVLEEDKLPTPSVLIGGTRIPAANVLFAGLAPQFVGLYQVNFTLPAGTAKGNAVAVVLEQGAARSRTDVTMAIQ